MLRQCVTKGEALRVYDHLCDMAWLRLGEGVLGTSRHLVYEVLEEFLVEGTMPLFWLETPLMGSPHTDLQVSYDYHEARDVVAHTQGQTPPRLALIGWLARYGRPGVGINYTIDLTEQGLGAVGAYAICNDGDGIDYSSLCASMGCEDYARRCQRIAGRFPAGWRHWCTNPYPGRPGNPVRATALATRGLRRQLADNPRAVRESLASVGLKSLPDELCLYVSKLATLPVALELRIGLDESDALCESFALSFYLARKPLRAADLAQLFCEGGPGWRALAWFEEWGIADERWRVVADAGFAKMVPFMRDGGARCRMALLCSPVCFMMPWEKDCPLPAKAYVSFRGRMLP